MELIKPFRGSLPDRVMIDQIIAPPYDVISRSDAKIVAKSPWNCLHLTRADIDCDDNIPSTDIKVYNKVKDNWRQFKANSIFTADHRANYYVLRIEDGTHVQTGLVCLVSMAAYHQQRILRHEHTRLPIEHDRVETIKAINAQISPVLLAYRNGTLITSTILEATNTPPLFDKVALDGALHSLWRVNNPTLITQLTEAVRDLGFLYLADGHHRTSAMSRIAFEHPNETEYQYALAVLFPEKDLKILGYHRMLKDLNGLKSSELLEKLSGDFKIESKARAVQPATYHDFGLYIDSQWYRLSYVHTSSGDLINQLPVSILHEKVIKPLFALSETGHYDRIDYVGGKSAFKTIEDRVNQGEMRCGFTLPPIEVGSVLDIADAKLIMPPKSTWFSPKLADGLVIYSMDEPR